MKITNIDLNGKQLKTSDIHTILQNNKVCNNIIANTINTIKQHYEQRK